MLTAFGFFVLGFLTVMYARFEWCGPRCDATFAAALSSMHGLLSGAWLVRGRRSDPVAARRYGEAPPGGDVADG
ncbi:MAG: hypothetical protein J0H06_03010 [Actinobacteria bacterium]|nr:hypothetical protein [Actinomycetota bacterium]